MIFARGVYGVGAEAMQVTQASIADKWFRGKFQTTANGINQFVSLAGAMVAIYILPEIYVKYRDLQWVFYVTTWVCGIALAFCCIFYFVEERLSKHQED